MQVENWLVAPYGQGLMQVGELLLALLLSSLIGLEREFRMKSAGLRTHALVGVSAALIMLVSKYGFTDVIAHNTVVLDPSRVAAQIVSGIGFIGGGLIFVQRDIVRGLTTAAIIWLAAAVGMACGAGLGLLAIAATALHFGVVYGYTPLTRRLLSQQVVLQVSYMAGKNAVQTVMEVCTGRGFVVREVAVEQGDDPLAIHVIRLHLRGRRDTSALMAAIGDIKGVQQVRMMPLAGAEE